MDSGGDLTRPEGLYRQLADRLRQDIDSGRLRPGDSLPSESQLSDRYRVSRQTVRKAISLLQAAGLIEVEHGRGSFVRRPPVRFPFSRYSNAARKPGHGPFETTCAKLGITGHGELVLVERIPADDDVAPGLGITAGSPVIHRRRYMHADDQILQIQDGYFDLALAAGTPIAGPTKLVDGTYAALHAAGYPPVAVTETIAVRAATYSEQAILRLKSAVPVLEIHRATFDANDRVLEWLIVVAAGDKNLFTYERLPLPDQS